jgi:HEPN domain-containing protein
MQPNREFKYRLKLTEGYIQEAQQDMSLQRWRSCVDNSQLAVENGAKAALALVGTVGRTHTPGDLLLDTSILSRFPEDLRQTVDQIANRARQLDTRVHFQSDYGDEKQGITPWELFGETEARDALQLAEETLRLVRQLVD